mgnify:CR=1 FL=1|jgi:hypothetical protein
MAKTYKQFVKTFKFRAKKDNESPKAFITARGKAMGKAWQEMKKKNEKKSSSTAKKSTAKKSTAKKSAAKKTTSKKKAPAKKKSTKRKK